MKKTTVLIALVILITFALMLSAAARFGVYEAVKNDQAVQVVNVDTGCGMNFVPEPEVWIVTNEKGEMIYTGGEGRAVEVFRWRCP